MVSRVREQHWKLGILSGPRFFFLFSSRCSCDSSLLLGDEPNWLRGGIYSVLIRDDCVSAAEVDFFFGFPVESSGRSNSEERSSCLI